MGFITRSEVRSTGKRRRKPRSRLSRFVALGALVVLAQTQLDLLTTRPDGRNIVSSTEPRVLLVTYVFGEQAANKKYLRMFVESSRRSGVDLAIVGSPPPPFSLPDNVRYVNTTWNEMVDRVQAKMFDGQDPSRLRRASPYKVIDLKPLFGFLFPETTAGYDWWGHVDNDMVLGNMRTFLTTDLLDSSDIICAIDDYRTWGPFTLYRNAKNVNQLFRLAVKPLKDIFNVSEPKFFDEWGHDGTGRKPVNPRKYHSSMAGIIEKHANRLGLRWNGGVVPSGYDGTCRDHRDNREPSCAECRLYRLPGGKQRLITPSRKDCGLEACEVGLCHFINAKNFTLEPSLADGATLERLVNDGAFRVTFEQGFTALD